MPNYKALYLKLFRAQNKAIQILVQAAQEAEEIVLDSKDPIELVEILQVEQKQLDENTPDA